MVKCKAIIVVLLYLMTVSTVYPQPVKAESQNHNITHLIPNPYNNVTVLNVIIQSPLNRAYNENTITLSFTVNSNAAPRQLWKAELYGLYLLQGVALDYDQNKLINLVEGSNLIDSFPHNALINYSNLGNDTYAGNATLTNLSQGYHNVTIWTRADASFISWGYPTGYSFTTVSFYVDSIPPHVSILTAQNTPYTTSDVPIEFTANKTLSTISYSLDGADNITVKGNFSLSNVPNGRHSLIIYVIDEAGNISNQTLNFTVEKPLIESFSITIAILAIPPVAVSLIVGLLLYRRHQRTSNLNQ
jgi:hypothetical protein